MVQMLDFVRFGVAILAISRGNSENRFIQTHIHLNNIDSPGLTIELTSFI